VIDELKMRFESGRKVVKGELKLRADTCKLSLGLIVFSPSLSLIHFPNVSYLGLIGSDRGQSDQIAERVELD
jgi:hypothetical protein